MPQSTDVGESASSALAGSSSGVSWSPEIVALIAQSVQAAMAAERAKTSSSPATSITSSAIGGVPAISTPTVNVVQPSAGRPVSTSSVIVPSLLPTFTAPALPAISLVASAASSLGGSSRDAGNACLHLLLRSWLINRSLLDLLFPRFRRNLCFRSWPARTLIVQSVSREPAG